MRKVALFVSMLLAVGLVVSPSAITASASDDPGLTGTGTLISPNVTYHGTIPIDSPGVGGEVVVRPDLGGKRFFYATGLKGLSVYDVTNPAVPVPAGFLPFPHSQNEDLKASDDGKTAIIAADGALAVPVNPVTTGIHVVDVTNPALPTIVASSNDRVMGRGTAAGPNEHTAECANADCSVIYGESGRIYRVDRQAGRVTEIGRWNKDKSGNTISSSVIHALNRDASGIVISDSTPRLILDPGVLTPGATPESPFVLAQQQPSPDPQDNRLQHNNVRPDAELWQPRHKRAKNDRLQTAVAGVDFEVSPRSVSVADVRTIMRPGEIVIGNTESNINPTCGNAGGLSTRSIVNFDRDARPVDLQPATSEFRLLETFKPLNGTWADGSPRVNALGCSGHWFTENDGVVAASWYEHGVHFFEVDKTVGTITEVGYFQPGATEAGAAYWIDDNFVYSVDYARGIDILSFNRGAPAPTQQQMDQAWLANLDQVGTAPAASLERYYCSQAALSVE
ncbi:MAG: hypothetical protein M3135_00235 [Actinomycetota bacterium]|nr:hypothetical protein [Actinomycetota bacterium]